MDMPGYILLLVMQGVVLSKAQYSTTNIGRAQFPARNTGPLEKGSPQYPSRNTGNLNTGASRSTTGSIGVPSYSARTRPIETSKTTIQTVSRKMAEMEKEQNKFEQQIRKLESQIHRSSKHQKEYKLGPLRCSGSEVVDHPETCQDLLSSGVDYTGYHFVGRPENIKLIYCNMNKVMANEPFNETVPFNASNIRRSDGMSTQQGTPVSKRYIEATERKIDELKKDIAKLQSTVRNLSRGTGAVTVSNVPSSSIGPVLFTAYRRTDNAVPGTFIEFDHVPINSGKGFDLLNSEFIAPVDGTYLFSLTLRNTNAPFTVAHIMKNRNIDLGVATATRNSNAIADHSFGMTILAKLYNGDKVSVFLEKGGVYNYKNNPENVFMGFLLN